MPNPFKPTRRPGRPATGRSPIVKLTLSPALLERVEVSASNFPFAESRQETIRRLLDKALSAEEHDLG